MDVYMNVSKYSKRSVVCDPMELGVICSCKPPDVDAGN